MTAIPLDLSFEGSLNESLLAAAGHDLDAFVLENFFRPRAGDVYATPGFGLPVAHILFVTIPVWRADFERADRDLLRCFRGGVETAQKMGLKRIAFPPIGMGQGGFSPARGARLALQGIKERLRGELAEIRIVCDRPALYEAFAERVEKRS